MKKYSFNEVKDTCGTVIEKGKGLIATAKDTSVHPNVGFSMEVNRKKTRKKLFDVNFHFDKEFSVFDLILNVLMFVAIIGTITTALDILFDTSSNSKAEKDE